MALDQRRPNGLVELTQKILSPQPQRLCVVAADVLKSLQCQSSLGLPVNVAQQFHG